ncbi:cysteine hydrolase family protein [Altererythrobacter sp. ZODW24]|uniref:cysteine hydrolase family protein n=1 Tax=Altererythrobacter sp. ZODW24 TaxID=2185142 RepID=UPI000DF76CF6|nr:cysteine hydrolase family protein [Altererythrobacter sp. ZODW24]
MTQSKKALVIVDVQQGMFGHPGHHPYDADAVVGRLADLLRRARSAGTPVFFVQHDGGAGSLLAADSPGFPFRDELAPLPSEDVTVKKHCSAFQATALAEKLHAAGVEHLIVGGMQSEFCVDTAVRGAFERGFAVTLLSDGHTTFDTPALSGQQIVAHHNHTLGSGSFATLAKCDALYLPAED